ncbi:putative cell wall protein AWA1-like [Daphnia sinensis]|uniref:Cell wall protein AWA1-like n=1 Tax=Daphnia sinensis TaxID=1820382 RepID=A0AAD5KDW7_9CRUS|nr:putative cell wall protein AWA1-like [Daphnia sinensis]
MGPEYVKVKRVGKNLHILFEDSQQADVIIEDYYEVMPEGYNGVVGQAENGNFYEYIPEDPDVKGLIPELVDGGESVSVALGGAEVSGAVLGLAGAGAAAAAAGGGGGTGGNAALAITAVSDNVGNPDNGSANLSSGGLTNDNTPTITGRAPAGSVVTIRDGSAVLGTTTADANGAWSFTPAALAEGSHSFTASASVNGSSTTTSAFTVVVDTVVPTVVVAADKTNLANSEEITVRFTLSEDSTDFTLVDVRPVNGTLTNLQGSGKNYTATFKPTAGVTSAMVSVDSDRFSDAAGNLNKDGAETNNTVSFSVGSGSGTALALAPTRWTPPRPPLRESSTDFVPGDVTVVNGELSNWQGSGTSYTATFRPNTGATSAAVVVSSDRFSDAAGNFNKDGADTNNAVSFSVGTGSGTNPVDTTPPTIAVSADKNNLANGETTTLRFTLSESSTDFVPGDVTVVNGSLTNWQGSGTSYTATFRPNTGATSAAVVVASDRFTDAAGNFNKDAWAPALAPAQPTPPRPPLLFPATKPVCLRANKQPSRLP